MQFAFTRYNLDARAYRFERFLEVLPGLMSWNILFWMTVLSFWKPVIAAVLIIAFDFYWFLKLFYMTVFLVLSYLRLSFEYRTHWMELVKRIDSLFGNKTPFTINMTRARFKQKVGSFIHRWELRRLKRSRNVPPSSEDIYHLVVIPILRESKTVVEPSIVSLVKSRYPAQRIMVVLAVEDRATKRVKDDAEEMKHKYHQHFLDFMVVFHPDGVVGEARVKGANATFAAKKAAQYFSEKGIPYKNITASCFDADTVVHPDYFSCLTYYFMITPYRDRASFQPIPVYHNNIWDAPSFARLLDIGSSFFQLIEATNPEKLVTFSSHSMSFNALVEIGYWPVDMISDDSAIFWKAFIYYDGKYRVVPMYITVSMDVVDAGDLRKTVVNVYKQKRRWAWGVENFPILVRAFFKADKISFYDKARYTIKLFEGHVSWATWPFLLAVIGWIPAIVASREFSSTVLYYNAPRITTTIFHLASLSLLITILLSISLLPAQRMRHPLLRKMRHAMEWILIPGISIFFSALPALDAQTRLMFGKYMEFWVTEKSRKKEDR